MKFRLFIFLLFLSNILVSQNKQVLYDFAEIPQTLLLNPALENSFKYHVGLPLLSGFSTQVSSSGFVLSDIFAVDNRNINDKVNEVINQISTGDYVKVFSQVDVINAGFRFREKNYISFGFYHEIDAISYLPKDVFLLATEGNNLNQRYSLSQLSYKVDVLGVLHFGLSRKVNEKLTIGGRFKLYSSAVNLESTNNTGTFVTIQGTNNIYTHFLNNINVVFRTSGLIDANTNQYINDESSYIKNTFLGDNMGFGFDFGINYQPSKQLQFSASILDLGFISHTENVKNTRANGSFVFEGIEFEYDPNSNTNYWEQLDNEFRTRIPTSDDTEAYTSWRPTKLNAALKYSFGELRSKECYDNTYQDFFTDAIGAQLHKVFRPLTTEFALTGFYQKSFSDKIHSKFTYTIDDLSLANIGAGLSVQLWNVNFYGMVDNILSLPNLSSANSVSLQLGINFLIK